MPTVNAGHRLHFQIYKFPPCTVMNEMQSKWPEHESSDLSYLRLGVIDLGAFGFQDKSMKVLREAIVLDCLLCFDAQSWILMPCHLLVTLPSFGVTCFAITAHAETQ